MSEDLNTTNMSKIDEVSINYEEDGILLIKELRKEILSKGAWATIMFFYQEYDKATQKYKPPKISLRRYQKKNGSYIQRSKFNISSEKQALLISTKINEWFSSVQSDAKTSEN